MADVQSLIDYYVDTLIIQYHNKPKARATIAAFIDEILASGLLFDIRDAFNVETAIGVQLDIVGKYQDIDRFYKKQVLDGYFSFTDYDEVTPPDTKKGFSDYTDFETKVGKWLVYSQILSQTFELNDEDFRFLIKLRIIQNNANSSHKAIDDSIFQFFGNSLVPDSDGNMQMNYFSDGTMSTLAGVALQKGVLPRPMGVHLGPIIVASETYWGLAGYEGYSELMEGCSIYADYDTKIGSTLTYDELVA